MEPEGPSGTPGSNEADRKLESWKEIAAYLGRTVRTAQRWEKTESLPVHRHHHDRQGTVFAHPAELEQWLSERTDGSGSATTAAPPGANRRASIWGASAAGALLALALVAGLILRDRRSENVISGGSTDDTPAGYELVLSDVVPSTPLNGRIHDFSPDGSELVRSARPTPERKERFPNLLHELYIGDTSGSLGRPLIDDAGDWEFVASPRWSPNGRYILYSLGKSQPVEWRLMLLDLEAGRSQHLGEASSVGGVWDATWMPDSQAFVIPSSDGFRVLGLRGEVKRLFATNLSPRTLMGGVSPDGHHLLYHHPSASTPGDSEMDISRLDLRTGKHKEVFNAPGFQGWPTWSVDGEQIYYVAGPDGARNIFRQGQEPAETAVQVTSYSNASVTHPVVLAEGGQLTFVLMKDNHLIQVAETSNVESPRSVARGSNAMLSPDGKRIYYLDNQPDRLGLWSVTLDGGEPRRLVSGKVLAARDSTSLLSPDGSRIAFAQHEGNATTLFTMVSSGGATTELYTTQDTGQLVPAWSPDSREVAFAVAEELLVVPADGGNPTVLASAAGWEAWSLAWSPDGRSIAAFALLSGERNNVVLVVDRATKSITRVTPESESAYKEMLAWHPDGERISYMYYNAEDSNGSRIAVVATGEVSDLVDMPDPMWDYVGTWGPDKRYFFVSVVRGYENLWSLHSYDEEQEAYATVRKLTNRSVSLPSWSLDGRMMAWSETEPVRQLWMMTQYE